ncbi:MAG: hypothetical protein P8J27_03130 [Mariniblastus sp.]|nr:hypothetical protein [Mariniblastus sp.]
MVDLKQLTLTVIDGDFPREVLANQNLKFNRFIMAAGRNKAERYNTRQHAPGGKKQGILITSYLKDLPGTKLPGDEGTRAVVQTHLKSSKSQRLRENAYTGFGIAGLVLLTLGVFPTRQQNKNEQ